MSATPRYQLRRIQALERATTLPPGAGGIAAQDAAEGYLYRPGQLLLDHGAVDVLRAETRSPRVCPDEQVNARLAECGVNLQKWDVPGDIALPELHRVVQGRARARGSDVELNHVLTGEWLYKGGPATEPVQAMCLPIPSPGTLQSVNPHLAVLDTGITQPAHALFAENLLAEDGTDVDLLDEDGNQILDTEAGHGTFICGLVRRVAPGLGIEQRKVLSSHGFGDDLTVALGVAETTAAVLNLSLGGYTGGNRQPLALAAALAALSPDRVVVAAAGNNARSRPFWPAAFRGVVAVAAYDSADGSPAPFSNHGPWVDVCAPGVELHSCYVEGRRSEDPDDPAFAGWAAWSGTSFAAPLVAGEIARRAAGSPDRSAAQVAREFVEELGDLPRDGYGRRFTPSVDVRLPSAADYSGQHP